MLAQLIDMELRCVRLQEERDLIALKADEMEQANKALQERLARAEDIFKKELELQQLQHLQVFASHQIISALMPPNADVPAVSLGRGGAKVGAESTVHQAARRQRS